MTIVVGYQATAEGSAALAAGIAEVERRDTRLVLVTSLRRGDDEAVLEGRRIALQPLRGSISGA